MLILFCRSEQPICGTQTLASSCMICQPGVGRGLGLSDRPKVCGLPTSTHSAPGSGTPGDEGCAFSCRCSAYSSPQLLITCTLAHRSGLVAPCHEAVKHSHLLLSEALGAEECEL